MNDFFKTIGQREFILALLISVLLLAIDLATFSYFPTPWCDEVSFSEPAINLAQQGRLETSVWPAQPAGTFWTANTPLYPIALAGWIQLFGQSLFALRSFNYVLLTLSCLGIWYLACHFQFSSRRASRLLLIPLIHLAYGVSFAYRSIRPDILGLLILVIYTAVFLLKRSPARSLLIIVCGIAGVWTGPQIGILIGTGAILAWLLGWIQTKDVICTAIGGLIGTLLFVWLLHLHHAIPDFMASVELGRTGGTGIHHTAADKMWKTFISYAKDYSLVPLLVASFYLTISQWRNFDSLSRKQVGFFWFWILVIPGLLNTTSNYGYYYTYMVYVPACLLLVLTADQRSPVQHASRLKPTHILLAASTVAIAVGLPTRLMIVGTQIKIASRGEFTQSLQQHIQPDDVALVENCVFFETKALTPRVFGELYHRFGKFSESEKNAVTVLIVYPADLNRYASSLGGEWTALGQPFGDSRVIHHDQAATIASRILDRYFSTPQMTRAPLQIFRRTQQTLE